MARARVLAARVLAAETHGATIGVACTGLGRAVGIPFPPAGQCLELEAWQRRVGCDAREKRILVAQEAG